MRLNIADWLIETILISLWTHLVKSKKSHISKKVLKWLIGPKIKVWPVLTGYFRVWRNHQFGYARLQARHGKEPLEIPILSSHLDQWTITHNQPFKKRGYLLGVTSFTYMVSPSFTYMVAPSLSHAQLLIRQQTLFFSDFTLENHVIQLQNLKKNHSKQSSPPPPQIQKPKAHKCFK